MKIRFALYALMFLAVTVSRPCFAAPSVKLLRVPNGGIQPQALIDERDVIHLVYFSGDPFKGDLFYVRSEDGGTAFSDPIRVNSQQGSAAAAGNIRGAHIAVGFGGRVHVAWNGSSVAQPRTPDGRAPMLYSRLDDAGHGFEPQRSLISSASGIDGGGAIAADSSGNVYVFWHAPLPGGKDEGDRRIWLAQSRDGGKTFEKEKLAFDQPTGVCGCCGMNAFVDSRGVLYALFRSAYDAVNRDMYLLVSGDHGQTFRATDLSKWKVGYCVMSSEAFARNGSTTLAAWETEKQVFYASVDGNGLAGSIIAAPGSGPNRKYPALALNARHEGLLAWTEGMGWKKGGALAWQVFDRNGLPIGETGHASGVPAWSLVAAFALADGSFRIVY